MSRSPVAALVARASTALTRSVGLLVVPIVLALELASTAWGAPVAATLLLLAGFACAFFAAAPESEPHAGAPAAARQRADAFAPRAAGAALAAVGFVICVPSWRALLGHVRGEVMALAPHLARPEWGVMLPVLGATALVTGCALARGRAPGGRDAERLGLLVALLFVAMLAAGVRVQGLPVLPAAQARGPAVLGAAVALAAAVGLPRLPFGLRLASVVAAAVAVRSVGLGTWRLDPVTRDMLPLAQSATDAWLAGEPPYALHQMQRGSEVPLTYLPGMWLLHAAPRAVGLDPRWTGVAADVAIVAAAVWAAGGAPAAARASARGLALGLGAAWLFSPSVHWNGVYAEPHPWWAVLAWLAATVARGRLWAAALLLGLAVFTRHFALVVAPFVALAMAARAGWRGTALRLSVAGALFAPALAAFVARDPDAFWFGTWRWLVEYGPAHQAWFREKYGFSGTLYAAGLTDWLYRGQLLGVAGCLALAAILRGARARFAAGALALVVFITFNRIVWDSFFLDGVVLAMVLATGAVAPASSPRALGRVALAGGAGAAVTALAAAGWLAASLARSVDRSGRDELRASVERGLSPATVVIDRSDVRLGPVRGEPLLPALGGRVWPDLVQLGAQGFTLPAADHVVWAGRVDRDDAAHEALLRLGGVTAPRVEGRYRWLALSGFAGWRSLARASPPDGAGECRVGRPPRRHLGVSTGAALRWERVTVARPLVVAARMDDAHVVWRGADAHVDVEVDGARRATLHVPNRPGPSWTVLDPGAGERSVVVRAREGKHGPGIVCVDLLAW
ncbi:MAG: hypothetical protein IT376_11255 [Polyangiaceae bacterium]|nr:hypothetical protein [Polyangiaceae bacterium]